MKNKGTNCQNLLFQIRYTDYGNEETIAFSDLTRCILHAKTATQMMVFCLNNIRPVNSKTWERAALEFANVLTKGKKCTISVHDQKDDNGSVIIRSTIHPIDSETDLATMLVKHNYAERASSFSKREREQSRIIEKAMRAQQSSDCNAKRKMIDSSNIFSNDEFLAYCRENLPASETLVSAPPSASGTIFDEVDSSLHNRYDQSFKNDSKIKSVYVKIDNTLNGYLDLITKHYKYEELNGKRFKCHVQKVIDASTILIVPDYVEPSREYFSDIKFSQSEPMLTAEMPVVLYESTKNAWLRGIIEEIRSNKRADVILVDTLDKVTVNRASLKLCPSYISNIPLKYALVQLYGVTPNSRYRQNDLIRCMEEAIEKCDSTYAIVKKGGKPLPAIKLVTDLSTKNLVYLDMIQNKMYKIL